MDVDEYQDKARKTFIDRPDRAFNDKSIMLAWYTTGIAGESGEFSNLIKKKVFGGHPITDEMLKIELGDLMWYISSVCSILGISLSEVLSKNLEKINKRYPKGYSAEASINRKE